MFFIIDILFSNYFLLLLFMSFATANPEPCLLRCKDNYMNQMQTLLSDSTSEWSINLVTPLQNLFHHASKDSIIPRVEAACRFHDTFMSCIGSCEETFARQAVLNGQESWISICHAFRTDEEFTNFILPCWAEHGDELSKKCHIHALMVQNSVVDLMQNQLRDIQNNLADLCRTITIYDKCYIWQTNEYCGEQGWRFLLKLNQRSSMALIKLLSDSALIDTLPPTCQQWTSPSKYAEWHAERIASAEYSSSMPSNPNYYSTIIIYILIFLRANFYHLII